MLFISTKIMFVWHKTDSLMLVESFAAGSWISYSTHEHLNWTPINYKHCHRYFRRSKVRYRSCVPPVILSYRWKRSLHNNYNISNNEKCKREVKNCATRNSEGASLVAQWLRIRLPMQGTRVRALVWEDPTCRGATKPVHHTTEPAL